MAKQAANAAESTDNREEAAEAPLLDSVAQAIKKMVAKGKERGYVTYDEVNPALQPPTACAWRRRGGWCPRSA